jgi:hypothetical protein
VPEEHAGRIAEVPTHVVEVVGERFDADAIGIDRDAAPAVPSIVPVRDGKDRRERVPQILPDEAVAEDAVAQDGVDVARRMPCRTGMNIQTGAVATRRERRRIIGGYRCGRRRERC